jgi:hypothetical protein
MQFIIYLQFHRVRDTFLIHHGQLGDYDVLGQILELKKCRDLLSEAENFLFFLPLFDCSNFEILIKRNPIAKMWIK